MENKVLNVFRNVLSWSNYRGLIMLNDTELINNIISAAVNNFPPIIHKGFFLSLDDKKSLGFALKLAEVVVR